MGNTYFRFKQFQVNQDMSSMKVCTDSCIFGAYVQPESAQKILDIGTGTGLLALMIAQKTEATIDAVEIESAAAAQAAENFSSSPWKERLRVINSSIQNFTKDSNQQYDLIVSNPPFFANHLLSPNEKVNKALHSTELSFKELAACVATLLAPKGKFYVLLPEYEASLLEEELKEHKLFSQSKLEVKDKSKGKTIREINGYCREQQSFTVQSLIIKNESGQYTSEFSQLLKPYYLFL